MRLNKLTLYRAMRAISSLFLGLLGGWFIGLTAAINRFGDLSDPVWQIIFIAWYSTICVFLFLVYMLFSGFECLFCPGREEVKRLRREGTRK